MHAMIDLETLSTRVDAACLSIGVALFDDTGVLEDSYYSLFDLDEQLRTRHVSASTISWWAMQSEDARKAVFQATEPRNSVSAIYDLLSMFFKTRDVTHVWAHGPSFDIAILDHMFASFGLNSPWKYNAVRDTRTMLDWLPNDIYDLVNTQYAGVKHNALDDAKRQAALMVAAMQFLRGKISPTI